MKVLFVIIMFSIFIWKFGIPSFKKYTSSGVSEDFSWVSDSPAVTVCALNKKTEAGWKTVATFNTASALDHYCDEQKSVKNATDCVEKKTFNFTEIIKALFYLGFEKVIGDSVNKAWRQYFFDFKSSKG